LFGLALHGNLKIVLPKVLGRWGMTEEAGEGGGGGGGRRGGVRVVVGVGGGVGGSVEKGRASRKHKAAHNNSQKHQCKA